MNIPIELVLFILLALYVRERFLLVSRNDYEKGYRQALKDIVDMWNYAADKKLTCKAFHDKLMKHCLKNGFKRE